MSQLKVKHSKTKKSNMTKLEIKPFYLNRTEIKKAFNLNRCRLQGLLFTYYIVQTESILHTSFTFT